jgi:hypothetical protein
MNEERGRAPIMRSAPVLLALLVLGLASACAGVPREVGVLEGRVSIGPVQPVERPGVTPTVPPEVYRARKVMVYDSSGSRLVRQVDIGSDGYYRVELRAGTYLVDINRVGIDSSDDVPRQVKVGAGLTVRLDIDIDTGIR